MLGSPTETEEELEMSIALIRKIQPYFMNNSYTTALPATYLYEKYYGDIIHSDYYRSFEDYDIRILKKLNNNIEDGKLIASRRYFDRLYGNCSFSNRARHFFRFPHFRRILYKRWKTLIFSRHPKFRHFLFDILAILMGSFVYFRNRNLYDDKNILSQS